MTWIKLIYGPIFNEHNTQFKKKQFEENLRGSLKYLLIEFRKLWAWKPTFEINFRNLWKYL